MTDLVVVQSNNTLSVASTAASLSIPVTTASLTVPQTVAALTVTQAANALTVATPGPQGVSGATGGGFIFSQTSAASSWTVIHNLGRWPNISYVDDLGFVWIADAEHIDLNTAVLVFSTPRTGKAVCS